MNSVVSGTPFLATQTIESEALCLDSSKLSERTKSYHPVKTSVIAFKLSATSSHKDF